MAGRRTGGGARASCIFLAGVCLMLTSVPAVAG